MQADMHYPAVPVRFVSLVAAWRKARKGKRPSHNQLAFDASWLDQLQDLQTALHAGTWQPECTVSFVVKHPKTREIHAPDFADRVVHHVLVERLEMLFEPVFIFDSFANRKGKGSHAAVDRLQSFMRARENMPGQSWYLQLDIHNYFNSIHRPTLYALLKRRLQIAEIGGKLSCKNATGLRSLCHKLLAKPVTQKVRNPGAVSLVPPHKLLCNAAKGCGLPVGNLTSQFFANVYLNELDQFIKHTLKVRHYVRYVDDFVLLGECPEQLQRWHKEIEYFLMQRLRLKLKNDARVEPCTSGIDFLGYHVFAHYRRVRQRVVQHCLAKLMHMQRQPINVDKLQAMLGSYWGHFSHANSVRLRQRIVARMPWLQSHFELDAAARLHLAAPGRQLVRRHQAVRGILKPEGEET
jgi:RNA-directed DNA polymerase